MSHFQPNDLYRSFKAICLLTLLVGTCVTIKTLSHVNEASHSRQGLMSRSQKDETNSFERGDENSASKKDETAVDHKITYSTRKSILEQLLPEDKFVLPNNVSGGIHRKTKIQQVARPIILFSVPPKCGSRTLLLVVNSLKTQNNSFQDVITLVDFSIVEKGSVSRKVQYINGAIDKAKAPAFLYTHAFYVPYAPTMVESDGVEKTLVRISIVRDPMERKISHYYYSRFRDSEPETKEEQVWRSHLKGIRRESFDDCLRFRRPECVAEKFHVRLISQFCGYEKGCGKKSKFALQKAKYNVENNYLLGRGVGSVALRLES
ncbi:Heparan sulfate 2-O-sulfotransferase 1 [Holothuria leucospilota]|uniref:Heparan sulfate 2-O-sulfotransferase 1 n=1 Tax=Holothuria leucospilota TaxID=206669 RepID=A0A9Q1BMW4_HOLLE|nr:Heparan sulfate 2-O-sulfotransferase 1 [Holothuria leucospilota]